MGNIRIGEEFVVVDLHQEWDFVGILTGHGTEDTEGGGNGVAATLDGELYDVLGIEIERILGKAGSGRVLDPLIDREDGEISGIGQATGAVHALEVGENAGITITESMDAIDEIGAGKMKKILGDRFALVGQE
jgi:hypothetical protein